MLSAEPGLVAIRLQSVSQVCVHPMPIYIRISYQLYHLHDKALLPSFILDCVSQQSFLVLLSCS